MFQLLIRSLLTVSDMSIRSFIPIVYICCIYIKIIYCKDLASCYSQPAESCPLPDKCQCVKTDETSLFCCQVHSNEDLIKNFDCSGINKILMDKIGTD